MKAPALAVALVSAAVLASAQPAQERPTLLRDVGYDQRLGEQVPLDLVFRDEVGRLIPLRSLFRGRAMVLSLVYYQCPMLCTLTLNGLASALSVLTFDVGKEFDVVTISIDPRDTPRQAAEKREKYVKRYGRFGAATGWHFLTGPESAIRKITAAAGFQYAYDIASNQFAHGTVLLVTTADGRLSRYLFGFEYKARDLRLALAEASQGKIGGAAEEVLLLCFHYDPATGKYSRSAMNFVRAGGVATVLCLGGFIVIMIRKERQQR